jgi:hypothetical protein
MGWSVSKGDCGFASVTVEGEITRFGEDEGMSVAIRFAPLAVDDLDT